MNGVNGFYQIYYNNTASLLGVDVDAGIFFDPFSFAFFINGILGRDLFDDIFDSLERGEDLFEYNGYDGLFSAVGRGEAAEDGVPQRSTIEILLDGNLGDGSTSDSESEEIEEGERRRDRISRKVGASGLVFYTFDPGTNRYSSYRVFGGGNR